MSGRETSSSEEEATLQAILAASPDIISLVGPEGPRTLPNPAIRDILGYEPEELAGMDGASLISPADREGVIEAFRSLLEGGAPVELRYRVRHADGHWVTLESRAQAVTDSDGRPSGAVVISRDVTERATLEEELVRARDEAEGANRAKSEFLSRMSHELRTPLNAILGFSQLLEMDGLDPEHQECVKQIHKGGKHLLDLINEVLDIARIETGRISLSVEPIVLAEALWEAIDLINPLAASQGIELKAEDAWPADRFVRADRQRLRQVLLNLLSNAVKYNRPGGVVTVLCTEVPPDWVRIEVTDQGPGIPPEMMDRLFVPFDRLGAEASGVEGTGLGLALSKGLVEAMGGSIGVRSEPRVGSAFFIDLHQAQAPGTGEEERDIASDLSDGVLQGPHTLLYVEDNTANLKLIEQALRRRPDVTLLSAAQGTLGLDLARQHQPDLVLLDLHLPDISGDEFIHRLRGDPTTEDIPVIVISADATPRQGRRLLGAGAKEYLTKPLDIHRFLQVLDGALKERELDRAEP